MTGTPAKPVLVSNLELYLLIAKEASAKAQESEEKHRTPKPGGTGFILTHDPGRVSFKNSVIAVVFAGIFLDALLHIEGKRRLGKSKYRKTRYENMVYEDKLKALGINDPKVLNDCERFGKSRNDLVHEKAVEIWPATKIKQQFRTAQKEARHALAAIDSIIRFLGFTLHE